MNIGGAGPKQSEWRVKHLKNIIKQTINLVPSSGNVQVDAGSRIYIDLPTDTTVDLPLFVCFLTDGLIPALNLMAGLWGIALLVFYQETFNRLYKI